MGRFKYPVFVILIVSACIGLIYLFNYVGVSPPWFLSLAVLLIAMSGDYVTTVKATELGAKEANPIPRFIFSKVGVRKGGLIIMGIVGVIVIFLWKPLYPQEQLAIGAAYLIVPINNLIVIWRRRKREMKDG